MKNSIKLVPILLLLIMPGAAQTISYLPLAPISEQDQRKAQVYINVKKL
jgi:hypothetical protein